MFNNREIATAIWLSLFVIWMLTKSDIRRSIGGVVCAFLNWKILTCIAAMILYSGVIVAGLYTIGLWEFPMIKDTVLWFCFTALAMVMRFVASQNDDNIIQKVFADNLKLIIVVEFLIGTYVMPLPLELAFVPLITFVVLLDAFVKPKREHKSLGKVTSFLIAFLGFAVFGFAVLSAIADFRNFGTWNTFRTVVFPPLMSIAFIPFIYAAFIIAAYESIFIRLNMGSDKSPTVVRYAKGRILSHCGLSLKRVRAILKRPPFEIMQIQTNDDVDQLFAVKPQHAG